ncbi:MAG: hypothetical protein E6G95_05760 [Alphaproteobacteria bacterium]|nr:MAG: hypothetical protein E6G95_05760 [Alphaproteobacteria bacterium]
MKARRIATIAAGLLVTGVAGPSLAQNVAVSPGYPGHVTDTRTGKVWTPSWDSLDAYQPTDPNHPVNREFNPRAQRESVPGMISQRPRAELMGTVPIAAGPSVPIMAIDAPSLQAVPGQRWIAVLYVTNNSANSIDAIVDCHFTNHAQKVESIRVYVPTAGPGERLGMAVRGPRVDTFVDKVVCVPMAPT